MCLPLAQNGRVHRFRELLATLAGTGMLGSSLRAAAAVTIPLVVGQAIDEPIAGLFGSIGALNVVLADTGGPIVQRVAGMSAALAGVTATIALGTALSGNPWAAVPVMLAVGFVSGLVRQVGDTGARVGLVVPVAFVFGAGIPGTGEVGERALAVLGGGLLALLLVALVWPFTADRPARRCLGAALRLVAGYARDPSAATQTAARDGVDRARFELESLGALHGRSSARLALLVVAVRGIARLYAACAVAARARARSEESDGFPQPEVDQALAAVAATAERLGAATSAGRPVCAADGVVDVAGAARACARAPAEDAQLAGRALTLAASHLDTVAHALAGDPPSAALVPIMPQRSLVEVVVDLGRSFRSQLEPGSAWWRFALKLGLAAAIAMAAALAFGIERFYWAPLTVLVILQPGTRETLQRARDRTLGTVGGAIVASLVFAAITALWFLDIVVFAAMAATLLLFVRAYRWSVVSVTILVLALISTVAPSGWELAAYRVIDTLLGAAVGVAVTLLLWPVPRRPLVVDRLADSVRAMAALERALAATYAGQATSRSPNQLSRAAGRALTAADAAARALPAGARADAAYRAVAGGRGALDALVALDLVRAEARSEVADRVQAFAEQLRSALADLVVALEREQEPAELPDFELGIASARAHAEEAPVEVGLALTELDRAAAGVVDLAEGVRSLLAPADARVAAATAAPVS